MSLAILPFNNYFLDEGREHEVERTKDCGHYDRKQNHEHGKPGGLAPGGPGDFGEFGAGSSEVFQERFHAVVVPSVGSERPNLKKPAALSINMPETRLKVNGRGGS
jgi:hypothetical protein